MTVGHRNDCRRKPKRGPYHRYIDFTVTDGKTTVKSWCIYMPRSRNISTQNAFNPSHIIGIKKHLPQTKGKPVSALLRQEEVPTTYRYRTERKETKPASYPHRENVHLHKAKTKVADNRGKEQFPTHLPSYRPNRDVSTLRPSDNHPKNRSQGP